MPVTLWHWLKNRRKYTVLDFDDIRRDIKRSDTVFILGTGESINEIPEKKWKYIAEHDSAGLNWWPLHSFIPTYYYSEYPHRREHFTFMQKILAERLSSEYTDTLFFLSLNRAVRRGIHPKTVPALFPENTKICFYQYTKPAKFNPENPPSRDSLRNNLFYRGSLTAVLDLMNRIGYKRIILLGVDLKQHIYFYENHPEILKMLDAGYGKPLQERLGKPHRTTHPKPGKISVQDYLFYLNDIYYRPEGIELYCGSGKSALAEKIPVFKFPEE